MSQIQLVAQVVLEQLLLELAVLLAMYFDKDDIFLQLYKSGSTLFLECPSSQLLHCPTARLDKRQAKESTKAPKNLQSVVHMVLDGGKIGDSKTSEFWSLQDFKSETD